MYETLGLSVPAPVAAIWLGALLGLAFGVLAQRTGFCLRRAVAGEPGDRRPALGVWLAALAVAVLGTQAAAVAGLIDFAGHRYLPTDLPVLAIVAGGMLFGLGMVLSRGCVSRLTVLAGSGNLRALLGLVVFAVVAHATLKGVLAPIRTAVGGVTLPLGETVSLAQLPGGAPVWSALIALAALFIALRSGVRRRDLALAGLLGLLVPAGWVGTGFLLYDDFDPVTFESLSFIAPTTETLFFVVASTAIPAGFGVGLVGGVLAGACAAALASRSFRWESFESPAQTGRSLAGAVLMGVGGVLAGGCTVGAGLAGVPTLGLAAILALASIVAGGLIGRQALAASSPRGRAIPAE